MKLSLKRRMYQFAFGGVLFASSVANSATVVLDFEGLGVLQNAAQYGVPLDTVIEQVGDFYNGGTGGSGSGPGTDLGVRFSDNALAIVDADATGLPQAAANFGGEPTPETVLFFLQGNAATMSFDQGFSTGFSFYYSSINFTGSIDVYDGPDATGNVLASLQLPTTQFNGAPDPTGQFSPFVPLGVSFNGVAKSIDFGGTINQIGFDNITFGSATPLDTNTTPAPTNPPTTPTTPTTPPVAVVPVPASLPLILAAFGMVGWVSRKSGKVRV